jgi:hypothetical protein
LFLLVPVGALVAWFGGCGISTAENGATGGSGIGSVSSSVSAGGGDLASGTGGAASGKLAAPCSSDADCGGDLTCLRPGDMDMVFGGGAPGGFCTKVCYGDAACATEGGVCLLTAPEEAGRCTLPCTLGPPVSGVPGLFVPLSSTKCRGREDVRCVKSTATSGVCLPTCGEDAQCGGGGGRCDPRTAVCVQTPSTGDPTGAACDPSVMPSNCAGQCIIFTTGLAMCSEPCVLGGASPQSLDCGGADHGLCAFHPTGNGAGDTGFCSPACMEQSDCGNPYFWCFGVPGLTEVLHRGYCFAAGGCPHGQSDCVPSNDGGVNQPPYVCTNTPAGPLCLDPQFSIAAGDAGAGDGGDSGMSDAGMSDAGTGDAGTGDASMAPNDAGYGDGATNDAGPDDAGMTMGSIDAGGDGGDGG